MISLALPLQFCAPRFLGEMKATQPVIPMALTTPTAGEEMLDSSPSRRILWFSLELLRRNCQGQGSSRFFRSKEVVFV